MQDPTDSDAGVYQCSARNSVGKAISNTTLVVKSGRARFPYDPVRNKTATIGQSLRLDCEPDQQSVPSPSFIDFSWEDNTESWPLSRRVQIDDNGMRTEVSEWWFGWVWGRVSANVVHTGWPHKMAPFLYALSSSYVNRFSKLFHCQN